MKTMLVVDDSTTLLMSIGGILSKAGYRVETAKSGPEALGKVRSGVKPDLVITDLNMPDMDGIELIRALRGTAGLRFTPILMLTTESQEKRRTEAKTAGATGWIVKPVGAADLLQVVKQVVPGA